MAATPAAANRPGPALRSSVGESPAVLRVLLRRRGREPPDPRHIAGTLDVQTGPRRLAVYAVLGESHWYASSESIYASTLSWLSFQRQGDSCRTESLVCHPHR